MSISVCMAACDNDHPPPSPVIVISGADGSSIRIHESDDAGEIQKICDALAPKETGSSSALRQQCDAVIGLKNKEAQLRVARAENARIIAEQQEARARHGRMIIGRIVAVIIMAAVVYGVAYAFYCA